MTGKSAYGADVQSPRMLPKQSSDFTGNPNGTDAYNSALMGHASVMRSRTSQTASEYALPDIYVPPGSLSVVCLHIMLLRFLMFYGRCVPVFF
jgi:hypothetical protein